MTPVRRAVAFSMMDKYLSQVVVIVTTAVMARIMSPAETGIYLTANAVMLMADAMRTFGLTAYIIQEREITRQRVRAAFTVIMLTSCAVGSIVFFGASSIAEFYQTPELGALLMVALISFLAVPFSSPILALLQRDMEFKALACINISAGLAGAIVTVGLAMGGMGAVSYAWGTVASSVLMVALALTVRPEFWIFRPSIAQTRQLLSFGVASSIITVSNLAYDLFPRLAFGRLLGFDAVGLFSRSATISQLPDRILISALQPVVLPALAAHARAGGDAKGGYLRGVGMMSAVQWPALIMLSILADPVVHVLLGHQWVEAAPLVRTMALANMALAPAFLTFPVLVAAGRIHDAVSASLISLPPSFLIAIFAAYFGLQAVVASFLVIAPVQMFVAYIFVRRAIKVTWTDLALAMRQSFWLAVGTAVIPVLVVVFSKTGFSLGWWQTTLALVGGAVGWILTILLVDHPIKLEILGAGHFLAANTAKIRLFVASKRVASQAK